MFSSIDQTTLPPCILIIGPTGVGKSDVAERIAQHLPSVIINGDMGQFYTPLTIGTAKPDWKNSSIPQYLFDILDEPIMVTVTQYRQKVISLIQSIALQKRVPIIVGGSSFYIKSLLFPPRAGLPINQQPSISSQEESWQVLNELDPIRAGQIHPHDTYRISRAIALYHELGVLPSTLAPQFSPFGPFILINVVRDRQDLYARINQRVNDMILQGWIGEVRGLMHTHWEPFLYQKKIIGYTEIMGYLSSCQQESTQELEEVIAQRTRAYAKRQICFNRSLVASLQQHCESRNDCCVQELNLTLTDVELYIKQLLKQPIISSFV